MRNHIALWNPMAKAFALCMLGGALAFIFVPFIPDF